MPSLPYATRKPLGHTGWLRAGWLVDTDGSSIWIPVDFPCRPVGIALADRYHGRLVRLMRLPARAVGLAPDESDAIHALFDPGPYGIETVLSEGWPGGPPVPSGWQLLGPVSLLLSALGRGWDADALLEAAAGRRE